jgi:FlaA1/EpsC-like NDP-sugar epimerase
LINIFQFRTRTPRWVIALFDLFIAGFALSFAYLIRFDLKASKDLIAAEWLILSRSILFYFLVKYVVFQYFQIQKGLVRFTSTEDLTRIFKATFICSLIFLMAGLLRFYVLDGYFLFPMSILILEFILSFAFGIGSRFAVKLIYLESVKLEGEQEQVVIYGAGVMGRIVKRTLENDRSKNRNIVAFIDDNSKLEGTRIEGTNVYAPSKLAYLKSEFAVNTLILAIEKTNYQSVNSVFNQCIQLDIIVNKVPSASQWMKGEFSSKQIRKIRIEDLLGRSPITLDLNHLREDIGGKIILVTGAAGSIGSGLVQQIAYHHPKKLLLFDQAESPMHDLELTVRKTYPQLSIEVIIGDICLAERVEKVFLDFKPQFIFHAAAYKHVPLMENNVHEAFRNNVLGTASLADMAVKFNVDKFVFVSTDKAVNPTNVMGATKRLAEIYVQSISEHGKTRFMTTRFGNVLGSNGSVIPLFEKQIAEGGPITVTDERITRFFMTIPEACQLVLEAGTMGKGGEIFVFDMGESVKIVDLARKMIALKGMKEGKDIQIQISGLRPGEKLYEEVLANEENTLPTHHPKILIAKTRETQQKQIKALKELLLVYPNLSEMELVSTIKVLIPEYISNHSKFQTLDL